jgi:N-methylhydantoinase A/oxoprolinase/acetone carboxylase beta subunit
MTGLGIDTGGTCTDAVLFDMDARRVLDTGKTLTTKENLELGIDTALGQLNEELLSEVQFVSLSTTLATNACVEGRGGRVKLLLIGVEEQTVADTYERYGFSSMEDFVFLEGEPTEGKEPDFDAFSKRMEEFAGCSGIAISQLFAAKNEGAYEKRAMEILSEHYDVPIICAYHMFSDLNAIKRGAGAFLNARLIPLIEEFLAAVKDVMKKRNLDAPIYIVRSDGTLMNEAFTRKYPVETLLCGPAASALGGAFLADVSDGLILDIGGTTTDVAIIRNHALKSVPDGISIGSWQTFVKGMYVDTFGLGGDTAVHVEQHNLVLENYRVMPVCMVAAQYPQLKQRILKESSYEAYSWVVPYEGFLLIKPLDESLDYTENERMLCRALGEGPLLLEEAAKAYGADLYTMKTKRLEQEGVILRFGLTPTDMMHVRGDYREYDVESAAAAIDWLARYLDIKQEVLLDAIFQKVTRRLYRNLVRILLENGSALYEKGVPDAVMEWIDQTYDPDAFDGIVPTLSSNMTLIGVGAPTHVFLPTVAEKLHASCILPENAKVANALGTLAGRVSCTKRAELNFSQEKGIGYEIFLDGKQHYFEECEEAEAFVEERLKQVAGQEVVSRGGCAEVSYVTEKKRLDPDLIYGSFVMGSTVTVTAYSFPRR